MFGLGMSEIIFLGLLALIVIGPKELPELARTIGRFMNELKRSTNVLGDELKQQTRLDRIDFHTANMSAAKPETPAPKSEPQQMELSEQTSETTKTEGPKPT